MSGLWAMANGVLARDPERRTGAKGIFALATLRIGNGDAAQWVSTIAFAEQAERLLSLHAGDAVSASGRAEMKTWQGRDGIERTGLSIVATEIAAARPRNSAPRRARATQRPSYSGPPLDDPVDDLHAGAR